MAVTPPTPVIELHAGSWTTSTDPKETTSFEVKKGDVIDAWVAVESANGTPAFSISGGSLTWTSRATENGGTTNRAAGFLWTAPVDSDKTMTIVFDRTAGQSAQRWGWGFKVWRGSDGVGKAASTNNGTGSGQPSLSLTTEFDNSAVDMLVVDFSGNEGARTWRTGAGEATETVQFANKEIYAVHGAHHADAGAKGAKTLGLTAPSTQRYVILAVEVKGTEAKGTQVTLTPGTETDSPQPLSFTKVIRKTLTPASETGMATARSAAKRVSPIAAVEADTAKSVSPVKHRTLTPALESDTALAVPRYKHVSLGPAAESDGANPLALVKSLLLGPASEVGIAQSISAVKTIGIELSAATETNSAVAAGIARRIGLVSATEADTAIAPSAVRHVTLAAVSEAGMAQAVSFHRSLTLAPVIEADGAQPLGWYHSVTLLAAQEADAALPLSYHLLGAPIDLTPAVESDQARSPAFSKPIREALGPATENEEAVALSFVKTILAVVVPASESDSALGLVLDQQIVGSGLPVAERDAIRRDIEVLYIPEAELAAIRTELI